MSHNLALCSVKAPPSAPATMTSMKISSNEDLINGVGPCRNNATSQSKGTSPSSITSKRGRSVSFGTMRVHEFPQILGDNPACGAGAPLTLDWQPVSQTTMLIDFYEFTRNPRRNKRGLKENKADRHNHLLSIGVTEEEIKQVLVAIESTKKDRAISLKKQTWNGFFKVIQSVASSTVNYPSKILSSSPPSGGNAAAIIATAKPTTSTKISARSA
jgi:hypothetical protein